MRHRVEEFSSYISRIFPKDEDGYEDRVVRTSTLQVTDACN